MLRTVRFAVGLAVATYAVMTVMAIVSGSRSAAHRNEGLWEYLRHEPDMFTLAVFPALAMLVAGLAAHVFTRGVSHRPLRIVIMTVVVPAIAFPLAVIMISRGVGVPVVLETLLFLLLPYALVTFIYTAMFLDSAPTPYEN